MDADMSLSPWHAGEAAAQRKAGYAERVDRAGRAGIRSFMPDQHRDFFAQLSFLLVGSVDADGWPWASVLSGEPGFASSPDPLTLRIGAWPVAGDPLGDAIHPDARLGLLGIEFATRRRNRMNGRVDRVGVRSFSVHVEQSFGNCPKYISRRDHAVVPRPAVRVEPFSTLDPEARALIERADAFFVATFAAEGGADISHRGGARGFVRISPDGALTIPDYAGNRFFNTLGNLMANPRAGLLFIDFENGDLLQLAGTTEIVWEGPEIATLDAIGHPGAERLWRVQPAHGRWLRGAFPLAFRAIL